MTAARDAGALSVLAWERVPGDAHGVAPHSPAVLDESALGTVAEAEDANGVDVAGLRGELRSGSQPSTPRSTASKSNSDPDDANDANSVQK